ncbi:hypothetical protein ABE10_06190 [Bacillus toyonensis]|nr:hypothetical protein [Bacillus toyonensis]
MRRKTLMERDLIDYPIALKRTKSRVRKIEMLREFERRHGGIPAELLHAFGHSEYVRGVDDGVADATGYGED